MLVGLVVKLSAWMRPGASGESSVQCKPMDREQKKYHELRPNPDLSSRSFPLFSEIYTAISTFRRIFGQLLF